MIGIFDTRAENPSAWAARNDEDVEFSVNGEITVF